MEDGISGWLQHCYKTCCEKGSCHGRQACMIWRWFHCRDIISRQVDLYMTIMFDLPILNVIEIEMNVDIMTQ